jgi:hypothetical protein
MSENILEKIEKIKSSLDKDPSNIVFGEIKMEKTPRFYDANDPLKDYYELLSRYSYLSCGSILIIGYDEIDRFQRYLSDNPECSSDWKCIGKSHTYPIFINVNDCTVKILQGEPWTGHEFRYYCHFNNFINHYVIGEKYKELWGEDDWFRFLVKISIV